LGLQLACRQDDSIRIVDVVTGEVRQSLPRAVEEQEILSFSATGERLAVRGGWGVFRSSLEVWDLAKGAQVPLDNLPHGRVSALAWKPDDSALALAHDDRQVWIQDLRRGVSEALPCDLPALVRSIGFRRMERRSPSAVRIAATGTTTSSKDGWSPFPGWWPGSNVGDSVAMVDCCWVW